MKGFDTLKVKSAVKNHNKFNLNRSHLTTMQIGEIIPLLAEETVPGDQFNVNGNYFSRLAPLTKPCYGDVQFKTVAGYVPYHMLADDAEAWLAGKTTWEGQTPKHRYITVGDLVSFITNGAVSTTTGASSQNCDFKYVTSAGVTEYRKWTDKGKYLMKIMNALGYATPSGVDLQTSSGWYTNVYSVRLSAYPLLAFLKLYNDYMSQSQRFNTSILTTYLYNIRHGKDISGIFGSVTGFITGAGILALLNEVKLNYDSDYFTSAWQSPNAPLNATESTTAIPVVSNGNVNQNANNTYANLGSAFPISVSQRALDMLRSFDNWVRRNNYSGSRAVQEVYSRFGIKTSDYRSNYAQVITTDSMPIQIGDVTATAEAYDGGGTTPAMNLGDYAGKGIMNGQGGFSVKCDDYGIILVLGYFTVRPMNAFGFDRKVLRNTPNDYFTPEFDAVGVDAISAGELFADPVMSGDPIYDTSVFGYTERYNSYKYGRDQITGEFRNFHAGAGTLNDWHTGRYLTDVRKAGTMLAQSTAVNTLPQTDSEYNRIFADTSTHEDHFYLTAQFAVDAVRPMLNLNQAVNLGEGDTVVPRNGNVIS